MFWINLFLSILLILISVAFYTILERKFLGYIQIRKGPNKVGFMGILQPFSDALKLFNKNLMSMEAMNMSISYLTPAMALFIAMFTLPLIPFNLYPLFDNKNSILLLFILSSLSVYFILMIGWSANSKYSHLGSIRSVAQMISYEVSFFLLIFFFSILSNSYYFTQISESQLLLYFFFGNCLIFMMWLLSCLAETNRSPFDFAEGESELVSGFNVEYMGGWFALIFLAEYMNMLILSILSTILFFKSTNSFFMIIFIALSLIWVRGTFPRFRYDMLMKLTWKLILPFTLFIIPFSMMYSLYMY